MIEKDYSIHNIITIRVKDYRNKISRSISLFEKDYHYFLVPPNTIQSPDIIIELGNFSPRSGGKIVENDIYYINDDYLFGSFKYKIAKYSFEVSNFNKESEPVILRINPNLFANRVIHEQVIDFITHFLMNLKGYPTLHASAISKNGKAIVFTGPGGAGKTSFSLFGLKNGFKFMGDDRLILNNGTVFSFPECVGFHRENINYVSNILKKSDKLKLFLNDFINFVSRGFLGSCIYLKANDIFSERIEHSSKIKTMIFIQPGSRFQMSKIDSNKAIEQLYVNQLYENRRFLKHIYNYSTIFPNNKLERSPDDYYNNLKINIPEDLEAYEVRITPNDYTRINEWLENEIFKGV